MSELSKLKWHCRRGVKELDIVLNGYLDFYFNNENEDPMEADFKALLELEDPILYAMLLGDIEPASAQQEHILKRLRNLKSKTK